MTPPTTSVPAVGVHNCIHNRIYHRSCEAMAELRDGSVDLIVTSPPYFVDTRDGFMRPALLREAADVDADTRIPDTYEALIGLLQRCFGECWRVLKPGGFCCVNVASTLVKGKLYPRPFDLAVRLRDAGWVLREEIIWRRWRGWDKRGGVVIQKPYPGYWFPNRVFDYVLVFKKPGGVPIYQGRTDEEKEASRVRVDDLLFHEVNNNIWNILPVQPGSKKGHPCPFPEELPARLIELYSYTGDLVLDPFTGSGTTGRVAIMLDRKFVGYEVNPDFARLARQRLEDTSPLRRERRVCRFKTLPAPLAPNDSSHPSHPSYPSHPSHSGHRNHDSQQKPNLAP
jgi:site-specific DNA-methyltransferase (adenine-specific)